jgi:hypothetical protein
MSKKNTLVRTLIKELCDAHWTIGHKEADNKNWEGQQSKIRQLQHDIYVRDEIIKQYEDMA